MAIGAYATLAAAKLRIYEAGTTAPTNFDTLLQELCDDVNSWIENRCQRVLAPIPTWSSTLVGAVSAAASTVSVAGIPDLHVGDDILIGLLSGVHESTNVLNIEAANFAPFETWQGATGYVNGDRVIPTSPNGHAYENTGATGISGSTEPTWPTNGGTAAGGTGITWQDLGLISYDLSVVPLAYAYPDASPAQTIVVQDGFSAVDEGRTIVYDPGLITLAAVETAAYTGGPWGVVQVGDWFLRPTPVDPGWPFFEVILTNVPHPSTTFPTFYPGYANIRLIGPGPCTGQTSVPFVGWPAIEETIRDIALKCVLVGFRGRTTAGTDTMTINIDGGRTFESMLSYTDRMTLERHRVKVARAV